MTADWGALQRAIDGGVVLPGSADYEAVRMPVPARGSATSTMRCPTTT